MDGQCQKFKRGTAIRKGRNMSWMTDYNHFQKFALSHPWILAPTCLQDTNHGCRGTLARSSHLAWVGPSWRGMGRRQVGCDQILYLPTLESLWSQACSAVMQGPFQPLLCAAHRWYTQALSPCATRSLHTYAPPCATPSPSQPSNLLPITTK